MFRSLKIKDQRKIKVSLKSFNLLFIKIVNTVN